MPYCCSHHSAGKSPERPSGKSDESAVSLSDFKDGESTDLKEGNFAVVYGTPEAWLSNKR